MVLAKSARPAAIGCAVGMLAVLLLAGCRASSSGGSSVALMDLTQMPSCRRVKNRELVRMLNGLSVLAARTIDLEEDLEVRILALSGLPGSAGIAETGEVATTLYVAVSTFDEYPEQSLFRLSPLYAPIVERLAAEHDKPVIRLTYGPKSNRRKLRIVVSLRGLKLDPPQEKEQK